MLRSPLSISFLIALVGIVVGPSAALGEDQADNPQFTAWTNFGVGSSATFQLDMQAGGRSITMTMVTRLAEKAADHIVIETTMTTEAGGIQHTTPPQKTTVPAKGNKVVVKDLGTEDVTAAGKTFGCKVHELKGTDPAHPDATIKVWLNSEVPGNVVKMEAAISGRVMTRLLKSFEAK